MYAVGRLGSYISRGVYTVSGPFHPFGGAVDIIVVEQQDGSFKSSPWYVRFGKFQGVLKTKEKEKVVNISVNGVQADFHMYLDHKGEAYFLREVDGEEANSVFYPSISGEAADEADNDLPINDRQGEMDSPLNDNMVNSLDHHMLHEEMGFHDSRMGNSSRFGFQKLGSSDKDCGVEMSCVNTNHIVETFTLDESGLLENYHLNSQTIREIDKLGVMNTDEIAKGFISESTSLDPDSAQHNACPSTKLDEEQVFKEKGIVSTGSGVSEEESRADRLEAFVYCATSESSRVGLDDYGGKTDEALHVSCRGCVEVCGHAKTLHQTAEPISEVTSVLDTSLLVAQEPLDNCGSFFNGAQILGSEGTFSNSIANSIASETYTQMVTVDPINGYLKEDESCSTCTISDFNKSIYGVQDEENTRDEDNMSNLQCSSKPVGDSQEFRCDSVSTEVMTVSPSDGSEEEHLLFGDLDDFNHGEVKCMESISSDHMEKEDRPSVTPKGSEAVIESLNPNDESYSSPDKFVQENMPNDAEDFRQKSRIVSSVINIPRSNKVSGENVERMAESLPIMWPQMDNLDLDDPFHYLGHSLDSNSESSKWMQLRGGISSCLKSDADKDLVSQEQPTVEDAQISEDLKNVPASPAIGNLSKAVDASNGSWRVWPFSFKRSRSMKTTLPAQKTTRNSDAENTLESSTSMDGEIDVPVKKKKVRAITPTPEQLTSLNLKEGKNIVTFTFSTAMLGQQQVDARIYFWKWDARVVISDVDGTITKSDVLGQFMPLVGVDWSQTGVAHLFSDIKDNGYQLLFLSARAIAQAYHTRQFLFNLKQDGKALPDGPVVISPDGLFPSLFREVVRRAPHEFKIACLEEIRALFPSDRNPFYAGFGNRDTDEISYLKVGIPKGKIFIINPKGKVVVNRCVDSKSYTELHAFVHDMFPPMSSSEQLEDFNSWNYWKLPPPAIDA